MDVASSFGSGDFGGFESHLGISEGLQLSKLGKKFLDAKFNVTLEAWKHNMRLCIQLRPKDLRMTQIFIFTKSAASVFLYHFFQMLLWYTEV